LSKYAQQVTILVRSASLATSMSQYLIREIEAAPNLDVRYRTEVASGDGDGRLEQLRLRHRDTGDTKTEPADGLFVLILHGVRAGRPGYRLGIPQTRARPW
jgi:thioredoxin reductase (NADPH)